jgi:hypothetical protein
MDFERESEGHVGHITKSLEAENDLTVFTVFETVNSDQILTQVIPFLTEEPTRLALWDFRAGSLSGIASNDLQSIVERGKQFADSRKGGRTAIVCSTDLDYGLGRMFQTFADIDRIPIEINIFRNLDDANEWLNIKLKA